MRSSGRAQSFGPAPRNPRNPLLSWSYLPSPVEGYYALRVVIVGCESTGKTTLCQRLAEEFKTNWVAEYARSFCEEMLKKKGVDYNNSNNGDEVLYDFKESDFEDFVVKQCMMEEEACRQSPSGIVFCDTNALCTRVVRTLLS